MTAGPGALGGAAGAPAGTPAADRAADAAEARRVREAAEQFEAVLLRELVRVMRRTAPNGGLADGSQGAGAQYMAMFDQTFADHLAESGGIGLAALVAGGLDGGDGPTTGTRHAFRAGHLPVGPTAEFPGDPAGGSVDRLRAAAQDLLDGGGARRFGREGTLLPSDLESALHTPTAGGVARFNVNDALGYRGYYKCNLFAFELARRAGYQVPVVGRDRGWGFPAADAVTRDAADRRVEGGWARVVTGASAATLDAALARGERAFLLTGEGEGERRGHMAVLERVRHVDYGADGRVERVVFDGWEARGDGARHLVDRTWHRVGAVGGHDPRGGFGRIEILELRAADGGAEVPLGRGPAAPTRDGAR